MFSSAVHASNWTDVSPAGFSGENFLDVYFVDNSTGFIVGTNSTILRTDDGGANWTEATSTPTTNTALNSVHFPVNDQTGYVAGENGNVWKTTDGGDTWTADNPAGSPIYYDVFFLDNSTGYVVGTAGTVFQGTSCDPGPCAWTDVSPAGTTSYQGIHFPASSTTGYVVGSTNDVRYTSNSGSAWETQTPPTGTPNVNEVIFPVDINTGYLVSDAGRISKTTNGGSGATWTTLTSGVSVALKGVSFPGTNTTGYVVGFSGTILKTTDSGSTWESQLSGTSNNLLGVHFPVDTDTGYAVGVSGTVIKTTAGGGNNFYMHPVADASTQFTASGCVNSFDCINDQTGNASTGTPEANSNAEFVTSSAASTDLYDLADNAIPAGSIVTGITITAKLARDTGPGPTMYLLYQRQGIDSSPVQGPAITTFSTTCCTTTEEFTVTGLNWSMNELNKLRIGFQHDGTNTVYVSQLYVQIAYTAGNGTTSTISGQIFNDANFNGTASAFGAGDTQLGGVDVELYRNSGGSYVYFESTTTDGSGNYSFTGVEDGNYRVRVRSASVGGSNPAPELAWANGAALYGGQNPSVDDTNTGDNAGPGDTYVEINVSSADVTGVDFGFAYNLIVNTNTSGQGSLGQFIDIANTAALLGANNKTTEFRIESATNRSNGGDNWHGIAFSQGNAGFAQLDGDADNVNIDGSTQTDNVGNTNSNGPEIEIYCSDCTGTGSPAYGFDLNAADITISNLTISGFNTAGIRLTGGQHKVHSNYIGTNGVGTAAASPSNTTGIILENIAANYSEIGNYVVSGDTVTSGLGNVISGNGAGIVNRNSSWIKIRGNLIGTNAAGTGLIGNSTYGIELRIDQASAQGVIVGGNHSDKANVIAGGTDGIVLSNNLIGADIQGNYIGTDTSGARDFGGTGSAVLANSTNVTPAFKIGGLQDGEANTIANYGGVGINYTMANAGTHLIQGNTIKATGGNGIVVSTAGARIEKNIIYDLTGSAQDGISVSGPGEAIYHNTIHNVAGDGIDVQSGATNSVVRNNSISSATGADIVNGEGLADTRITYNNFFSNGSTICSVSCDGSNTTNDPNFLDASIGNFTLACGSLLIDAGLDIDTLGNGEVQTDLNGATAGNYTGSAPDVGAIDGTCGVTYSISGTVFDDADFAGTASEYDGGTNDVGLSSVDVELYSNTGVYKTSVTTAGDGSFTFPGLADGTYQIRVRSATIGGANPEPEMTWGNGIAIIGGQVASVADSATGDNAGVGDNYTAVVLGTANLTGVNFGFAYNLIVNTNDTGQGSFRQFIEIANAGLLSANNRTAQFKIPGSDSGFTTSGSDSYWLIQPSTKFPTLSAANISLDATTQTTSQGDTNTQGPEVVIDGSLTSGDTTSDGFVMGANSISIKGFVINNFPDRGIDVLDNFSGGLIAGNYIGTDFKGTVAQPNLEGIYINGDLSSTVTLTIGGNTTADRNLISGNTNNGIYYMGNQSWSDDVVVEGNWIGVDATGNSAMANGARGVQFNGPGTLGGSTSAERNIISGNGTDGVFVSSNAQGTFVQNNYIGLGSDGSTTVANGNFGVNGLSPGDVTIGGAGTGNVISGNASSGIYVSGAGNTVTVQGNKIGSDASGTVSIPNGGAGIWALYLSSTNATSSMTIGGTGTGEGNLVLNSPDVGIRLHVSSSGPHEISGNTVLNSAQDGIAVIKAPSSSLKIQLNTIDSAGNHGIYLNTGITNDIEGARVYHNTVYNSAVDGLFINTGVENVTVQNNLFSQNTGWGINDTNAKITTLSNNIYNDNTGGTCTGANCASPTNSAGSMFTDAANDDFSLLNCSVAAVDAGVDLVADQPDMNGASAGNFNGGAPDAGALESSCSSGSTISGLVFSDADFAGTASTYDGGTSDVAVSGADVELYDNSDVYQTSASTAADGSYSFTNLADGTYKVRVRSATVNGGSPLPELAWANGSALYGGQDPTVDDTSTGDNAGIGDTYVTVIVSGGNVSNVDFGFAYNLIVNAENSGQGSLRQFMLNANGGALSGATLTSQFRMQVATNQNSGADNWWRISPASELPILTSIGNNLVLDASTQRTNSGSDSNASGPEIEINGASCTSCDGFNLNNATGVTINEFVINGFTNGIDLGASASNAVVTGNFIGADATGTVGTGNTGHGVFVQGTGATIGGNTSALRNVISANSQSGIFSSNTANVASISIQGNYIGTNAAGTAGLGNGVRGITLQSAAVSSTVLIGGIGDGEGNLVGYTTNTSGSGIFIDVDGGTHEISGNTIRNSNGNGLYIFGATNLDVHKNIIHDNGDGDDHAVYVWQGSNINFVNNTIYNSNVDGINISGGSSFTVQNNIFSNNGNNAIQDNVPAITTISNNNYFGNAGTCSGANCGSDTNSITTDPLFVNAASGDFSLTECTSGAINTGVDLGAGQPDMNGATAGNFNGSAPDMGAVESSCVSTTIVTNNNDSGAGSLRQAILDASANQLITFDTGAFPSGTPATITLASNLPDLTDGGVTIDASGAGVILDGASTYTCIVINSNNNVVKGLRIQNCSVHGVYIQTGTGNTIGGDNTAGTGPSGEGNVIIFNGSGGVQIESDSNFVYGNYIGIDTDSTAGANGSTNVMIFNADSNTVGATGAGFRNILSYSPSRGLRIQHGIGNTAVNNYIGTNVGGTAAAPNLHGVLIDGTSTGNTIGGTGAGEANVISGNNVNGIVLQDASVASNNIYGNYIGVQADGITALGNAQHNIYINTSAHDNVIGGTGAGEANIIANAGTGSGVEVTSGLNNTISGNRIYSNATNGITLQAGAHNDKAAPTITNITINGSDFDIVATVTSGDTIEFFRANNASSPTVTADAAGEGYLYLGSCVDNGACTGPHINAVADADATAGTVQATLLSSGVVTNDSISATATDATNGTSQFASNFTAPGASYSISGIVFEDADYAGTPANWDSGASDLGASNVTVELYDSGNSLVDTTTTAGDGSYSFTSLSSDTYKVRLVSSTIGDADTIPHGGYNACVPATCSYPVPEMTWGYNAALLGGQSKTTSDIGAAAPGDTYASVTVSGASVSNVNLGFAYNGIVNANDGDQGSFRQFILNANAIGSANGTTANITEFDTSVFTTAVTVQIFPATGYPDITDDGTVIDASDNRIIINGSSVPAGVNGLTIQSNNNVIKGISIQYFTGDGVEITSGTGNTLGGNNTVGAGPYKESLIILYNGDGLANGGDVTDDGIEINTNGNFVYGSFIGTNGAADAGNTGNGIYIAGDSNTIGGATNETWNIISGNGVNGIYIDGGNFNTVQGNRIGTNSAMDASIQNDGRGVWIAGGSTFNTIGGDTVLEANTISGNGSTGVYVTDSGSDNNTISGNYIGTNASGTNLGNGGTGVFISASAGFTTIGGATTADGNVIAFNATYGIGYNTDSVDAHLVGNNYIGTNASSDNLGNVSHGMNCNLVNGAIAFMDNVISYNGGVGINGACSLSLSGTNDINDDIALTGITLFLNNGTLNFSGDMTNTTTTITGGTSTVVFDGTTAQSITAGSGATNFQNIEVTNASAGGVTFNDEFTTVNFTAETPGSVLTFTSGLTYIFTGTLSLNGQENTTRIQLNASAASAYTFDIQSETQYAYFVDVDYSYTETNNIIAYESIDPSSTTDAALAAPHWIFESAIVVNTTTYDDGNPDSLRQAFINAISGQNIVFNPNTFPSDDPQTITLTESIAANTDNLIITGENAGVIIDGGGTVGTCLTINSSNVTVRGLRIQNCTENGILINSGTNNTIGGNNTSGKSRSGEGNILILNGTGGTGNGLRINSNNNFVYGNYIGVSPSSYPGYSAAEDLGNVANGIYIAATASGNIIGDTATGRLNILSNNDVNGIEISGNANTLIANYIGVNEDASAASGNTASGILLSGSATGNTIGGNNGNEGNLIAGNTTDGVVQNSTGTNTLQGNTISHASFPNGDDGIDVRNGTLTLTVNGGSQQNVINSNTGFGLHVNSGAISLDTSLDINDDVRLTSGSVNMGDATVNLAGNWIHVAGSVTEGTSTLILDGTTPQDIGTGAGNNFYNLDVQNSPNLIRFFDGFSCNNFTATLASTNLQFNAGDTYSINGTLNLNGQATSTEVVLASDSPGTGFIFDVTSGDQTVQYVSVTDSHASSNDIRALSSVNGGGNDDAEASPHWVFVATSLVVTNTASSGAGSLLSALAAASANDTVYFDSTVFATSQADVDVTISPTDATLLDMATGSVSIDASNVKAIIDGASLTSAPCIEISTSNNTVMGLQIQNCPQDGILISAGTGNTIGGDNTSGSGPFGEGNVIISNGRNGIQIDSGSNAVYGNYLGTNTSSGAGLGNAVAGINVNGVSATIGGIGTGQRNVISGNGYGINLRGGSASVVANYIGTNVGGTAALANSFYGIYMDSASNTIGGSNPGEGNVISGNTLFGIAFNESGADNNNIYGNFIGTNFDASSALANNSGGIYVGNLVSGNSIGGTAAGQGNVISGNGGDGIQFISFSNNTSVHGNYIGTNASSDSIPNTGDGIEVGTAGTVNLGDASETQSNIIAANGGNGINQSAGTISLGGTIDVNDNVNLSGGTFTMNDATMNVAGNFSRGGSVTLNANTSTIVFDGTNTQNINSNSAVYNNITVTNASNPVIFQNAFTTQNLTAVTPDSELQFQPGTTFTINGTLNINGQTTGTEITLNSTDNTNQFTLAVATDQSVAYTNVSNSNADVSDIYAYFSNDVAGNDTLDPSPHWIFNSNLAIAKRAFLADGTPIASGSVLPAGTQVKYMLYINNIQAAGASDVSVIDVLDPAFVYQNDTIKIDNSIGACAAVLCTAAEEAAIFAAVDDNSISTDGIDGDAISYSAGTATVEAGNRIESNSSLNILGNRVWVILFTVSVQ